MFTGDNFQLEGKTFDTTNINVFHNSRPGYPPSTSDNNNRYSTMTSIDYCTQISFYSFIDTSDGNHTLILNIHTVDNIQ